MNAQAVEALEGESSSGVERRAKLHNTIASLITLRQSVMASYAKLAGIESFSERGVEALQPQSEHLRSFCQVMVDYTAMGHFEVYQRIIEGKERRRAVQEAAADVYPAIAETTDYLVDFNDKYDEVNSETADSETLAADLPRLGEIIALRSDLEDQILAALHR